jgi:hypothetical protein
MHLDRRGQENSGAGKVSHRTKECSMLRRVPVVLLAGLALAFGLATTATAAPTTETIHEKGLVETFEDTVPSCEGGGESYIVTTTTNLVEHVTEFDDGRGHFTFPQSGKVSAIPADGTGPTYTGHLAVWSGFNANNQETNGTFTFNITLKGSDGSKVSHHEVEHFDQRPDGTVHEFFRCH